MNKLESSIFILLIPIVFGAGLQPALGWELERYLEDSDIFPQTELVTLDEGEGMRSQLSAPITKPGADAISLRLEFSANGSEWAYVYVYDSYGVMRERIAWEDLPSGTQGIWTDFVAGEKAALMVEADSGPQVEIKITESTIKGFVGEQNTVFGSPTFESVSVLGNEGPAWVVPLIASVIVDPNAADLAGEPQWAEVCTGILIGPDLLLTAGHCIFYDKETCAGTVAIFGLGHNVAEPVRGRRCVDVAYLGHSIDTAILRLAGSGPEGPFPKLPIEGPSPEQAVLVLQHPRGALMRVSRDSACKIVSPVTRLWPESVQANLSSAQSAGFSHHCDTLKGSSGSPILSEDGSVLLGIQHAGVKVSGLNYAVRSDIIRYCTGYEAGDVAQQVPEDAFCH